MTPTPIDEATIRRRLEAAGLRPTLARRLLLGLLYESNRHYTPEEMLDALRARGQPMSVATLYQNLRQLVERGLLRKVTGPDGVVRYDANTAPHHHLACVRCGRLVDVAVEGLPPAFKPVPLPTTPPEVRDDLDRWTILAPHVELMGICPRCRREREHGLELERGERGQDPAQAGGVVEGA